MAEKMKSISKIVVYYTDGTYQEVSNTWGVNGGQIPVQTETGTFTVHTGCKVCGIGKNGEAVGYVCNRGDSRRE
jgi:hypothetical protein